MRFSILFLICHLTVGLAQSNSLPAETCHDAPRGASVADQLVGAWRLVCVAMLRPNSERIYPFYGKRPEGLLVYDRADECSNRRLP